MLHAPHNGPIMQHHEKEKDRSMSRDSMHIADWGMNWISMFRNLLGSSELLMLKKWVGFLFMSLSSSARLFHIIWCCPSQKDVKHEGYECFFAFFFLSAMNMYRSLDIMVPWVKHLHKTLLEGSFYNKSLFELNDWVCKCIVALSKLSFAIDFAFFMYIFRIKI